MKILIRTLLCEKHAKQLDRAIPHKPEYYKLIKYKGSLSCQVVPDRFILCYNKAVYKLLVELELDEAINSLMKRRHKP